MPTVSSEGHYRFFFFSADRDEPPHIHVEAGDYVAKFWLSPVWLASSRGFNDKELNTLQKLVQEREQEFLEAWHEFFGS